MSFLIPLPALPDMHGWLGGPSSVSLTDDALSAFVLDERVGGAPTDLPLLRPASVFVVCVFYVLFIVFATPRICAVLDTSGESKPFKAAVALHNLALCLYSAWTFASFAPILLNSLNDRGWWPTYCDSKELMWNEGLAGIAYLFYLSKVWEFADTVILCVKRKPVSWLQSYHHIGAFVTMWLFVVSHTSHVMWFVFLNSALHTVMYFYYFMSLVGLGSYVQFAKHWITRLQILQFLVGIGFGLLLVAPYFMGSDVALFGGPRILKCSHLPQVWALTFCSGYLFPLLVLFLNFYVKTYRRAGRPQQGIRVKSD